MLTATFILAISYVISNSCGAAAKVNSNDYCPAVTEYDFTAYVHTTVVAVPTTICLEGDITFIVNSPTTIDTITQGKIVESNAAHYEGKHHKWGPIDISETPCKSQSSSTTISTSSSSFSGNPTLTGTSTIVSIASTSSTSQPSTTTSAPSTAANTSSSSSVTTSTSPTTVSSSSTTMTTTTSATSTAGPTFNCPVNGFLLQEDPQTRNTNLFRIDVATGTTTLIAQLQGFVSNIGYNILDGYLYGFRVTGNGTAFVQIDAQGQPTPVGQIPPLPSGQVETGDVDDQGRYWVSQFGATWVEFDTVSRTITSTGLINNTVGAFGDWAYVPGGGNALWAITTNQTTGNSHLVRFDRSLHTLSTIGSYGILNNGTASLTNAFWVSTYASASGTLYASDYQSGSTFRFFLDGLAAEYVSQSPSGFFSDGAHCFLNNVTSPEPPAPT